MQSRASAERAAGRARAELLTDVLGLAIRLLSESREPARCRLLHYSRLSCSILILLTHLNLTLLSVLLPATVFPANLAAWKDYDCSHSIVQAKAFGPGALHSPARWPGKRQLSCRI
jgi:hypothetical protein